MIRKPLWSREFINKQGGATKEAKSTLYFGCLTNITNTPAFCNLRSIIWCRQRTWKIHIGLQHEANGLNQVMGFDMSTVKLFEQSSQMSTLQYLSSWSIWNSPYYIGFWAPSIKNLKKEYTRTRKRRRPGCWS